MILLPKMTATAVLRTIRAAQLLLLSFLSVYAPAQMATNQSGGTTEQVVVPATSISNSKLDDSTTQPVVIYLPPGYAAQTGRRYSVLYLLHGFSLHSILEDWKEVIAQSMNEFLQKNPNKAFIVVIPNGANKVDGSFYMDSDVGGNWERYISKDLVS